LGLGIGLASNVYAQNESLIPSWIKTAVGFWANDQVSDQEFLYAIEYLVENELIHVFDSKNSSDDRLFENLNLLHAAINFM